MKRCVLSVLSIIYFNTIVAITTYSPDQPSMNYLEPEAEAVGFTREWLRAVHKDPIIQSAEQSSALASPQEGRDIWLKAANQQAALGKANEVIYCFYRRLPYIKEWNTAPFVWAFFIDLGTLMDKQKDKKLPENPLSIGIKNDDISLIETVMPKEGDFIKELPGALQALICQILIKLTRQAIRQKNIPITSTLINRIKKYAVWDHPALQPLKPTLVKAAGNNNEMLQMLANEGLS